MSRNVKVTVNLEAIVGGWAEGWVEVKVVLWIGYSIYKQLCSVWEVLKRAPWCLSRGARPKPKNFNNTFWQRCPIHFSALSVQPVLV